MAGRGRILVVDDDTAILDIIVQLLTAEGYEVDSALNGDEALERLRVSTPAMILLDLWMPKMNGWEFRRHQMELPAASKVPVVLLSAGGNLQRHASDLRAAAALAKPFDLDELLRTVEAVFTQHYA